MWKIWFVPGSFLEYYPITESLQWIQWQLWGNDTFGYHLTNVILHIIGSLLVWRLLSKFGLRWGWLGGLLFAVHPLAVESVAWISELKNVLSLPPFILALCSWIDYEENTQRRNYCLALGWFLVALLCKSSAALFPILILIYALWKQRRVGWHDLKASTPFFVISLALGSITLLAGTLYAREHIARLDSFSLPELGPRLALALLAIPTCIVKFIWPVGLLPVYREWTLDLSSIPLWILLFTFVALFYETWRSPQRWGRHFILGFGFFLINLIPLQLYIIGEYHTMVWSLDHLHYISIIGLIGLTVAAMESIGRKTSSLTPLLLGAVLAVSLLLALQSRFYAGCFASKERLWSYTLGVDPANWQAHNYMGLYWKDSGRLAESIVQFEAAAKLRPDSADTQYNLGCALALANRLPEAIEHFHNAVKLDPRSFQAYDDWGAALFQEGKVPEAMDLFRQALSLNSNFAQAHNDLGNALLGENRFDEARKEYEKAIQVDPSVSIVHTNLGLALAKMGRVREAEEQFKAALKLNPDDEVARQNLDLEKK